MAHASKIHKVYEAQSALSRVRELMPSEYPNFKSDDYEMALQLERVEKDIGRKVLELMDLIDVGLGKKEELRRSRLNE